MCPYYPALKVKRPYFHPIMKARLKSHIHQVISTHLTSNSFRLFSFSSLSTRSPSYFQFFPFLFFSFPFYKLPILPQTLSLSTCSPSYLQLFPPLFFLFPFFPLPILLPIFSVSFLLFPCLPAPHLTYNSFRSFSALFFQFLLFPFLPAPYLTSNSFRICYSSSLSTHFPSAILPPTLSVPFLLFSFLQTPHLTSNSFLFFSSSSLFFPILLFPFLPAPYLTSNSFHLFYSSSFSTHSPSAILPPTLSVPFFFPLYPLPILPSILSVSFLLLPSLPAPHLTSNSFRLLSSSSLSTRSPSYLQLLPFLFFFFPLYPRPILPPTLSVSFLLLPSLPAPHLTYNYFRLFSSSSLSNRSPYYLQFFPSHFFFFPLYPLPILPPTLSVSCLLLPSLPAPHLTSNSYRFFSFSSLSTRDPSYLQHFPFLFFFFPLYPLPILPTTISVSFHLLPSLTATHLTYLQLFPSLFFFFPFYPLLFFQLLI